MESTTKKVILPTKGICNITPDPICNDDELLDCIGLTYHNDALRPIQRPSYTKMKASAKLMYVHALNSGDKYYIYADGTILSWCQEGGSNDDDFNLVQFDAHMDTIISVASVGNTLIVNTSDDNSDVLTGTYYFLFSNGTYISLGNKIPEPDLMFDLTTTTTNPFGYQGRALISYDDFSLNGIASFSESNISISDTNFQAFCDSVLGSFAKVRKQIAETSGFAFPFFIRYALELYDGTYVMPSAPILIMPSTTDNFSLHPVPGSGAFCRLALRYFKLEYINKSDYTHWKDIVKKIAIFASDEINIYDTSKLENGTVNSNHEHIYTLNAQDIVWKGIKHSFEIVNETTYTQMMRKRNTDDIYNDICSQSVFYHIADIETKTIKKNPTDSNWQRLKIREHVIENLTTQPQLVNAINGDDFYSHCEIYTNNNITTFNRRLNLCGVKRGFFEGFKQFGPCIDLGVEDNAEIIVVIRTNEGNVKVRTTSQHYKFTNYAWFFYPDPRAFEAYINGYKINLKEHTGLNGAYFFGGIPTASGDNADLWGDEKPSSIPYARYETLPNYLLQSEVDNPFTFFASGYVRVGQGTIIGMAGLTTALSQDAYKVSTTLVFTTQGIWALTINEEGQYKAVAPPFSREVCNNPKSITMIDHGVFFTSEKGLMLITDNGISCVSAHLMGKNIDDDIYDEIDPVMFANFRSFLKDCSIAYDYRDSQIIITNSAFSYHWVYNIKSGTFTRFADGSKYKAIVSDYPDTLMQATDGKVYSLINEPDINDDIEPYEATLITRPMKFNESVKLKSLRELKHITDFHENALTRATVELSIFGSNDCRHWQKIESLAGRGFKYFIFRYDFDDLRATDSFCGTIVGYNTKQTNKLR